MPASREFSIPPAIPLFQPLFADEGVGAQRHPLTNGRRHPPGSCSGG